MVDRSHTAPAHLFSWLMAPAALGAFGAVLSAATSLFRHRPGPPALPRMSEEWLKNLDHDAGRRLEYWRDR